MILSHQSIRDHYPPLLEPMFERRVIRGLSGGISGSGYDIHLREGRWLWPKCLRLASAVERFNMPNNISAVVHDKSSLARLGITVQNTYIEAGWCGYLTLEITNHSWRPVRLSPGQPVAQVVFHWLDRATDRPYRGKYQDQPAMPVASRREL